MSYREESVEQKLASENERLTRALAERDAKIKDINKGLEVLNTELGNTLIAIEVISACALVVAFFVAGCCKLYDGRELEALKFFGGVLGVLAMLHRLIVGRWCW